MRRNLQMGGTPPKPESLFVGGPYDGMKLTIDQINKFANLTPIGTRHGVRLFVLLPPLKDWEMIVSGDMAKESEFETLYCYERRFIPGGAEFFSCSEDEISRALADR